MKKKIRTKEDEAIVRSALKKKVDALMTLKGLEGHYETCTTEDELRNKMIHAIIDLQEAQDILDSME